MCFAYVQRFDVMSEKFLGDELNKASLVVDREILHIANILLYHVRLRDNILSHNDQKDLVFMFLYS